MAVDTAVKRKSLAAVPLAFNPGVSADASKPAVWRYAAAGSYYQVAAAGGGGGQVFKTMIIRVSQ